MQNDEEKEIETKDIAHEERIDLQNPNVIHWKIVTMFCIRFLNRFCKKFGYTYSPQSFSHRTRFGSDVTVEIRVDRGRKCSRNFGIMP